MSSRLEFGTLKRILAVVAAIVIVLAAGVLVGQAPAIFGVDEDPTAEITFEDQHGDGDQVVIDEVTLSEGGFVVITDGDERLAVSAYLGAGTHENVTIESEADGDLVGQLTATVHQETTDDESFAYDETDGEEDQPYLQDGFPVSATATVTTDEEPVADDSFVVESIDAPATATTNETIEVTGEVRNPTELTTQQTVAFRLDGEVIERQILELDAEENQTVTFEIDTAGMPPGNQTIGIYTDSDAELTELELEFHTDPGVTIVDADTQSATVDTAIPEPGFVAITDDDTVIGTSDELDPGEHSNVTIEFDESVDEDQTLTAVLASGDPGDPEAATPIEVDGDPVETPFTIADVADADDADDAEEADDAEDE